MEKLAHLTFSAAEMVSRYVSMGAASSCQSMVDSASLQITARRGSYLTGMQNVLMEFAPRESLLQ